MHSDHHMHRCPCAASSLGHVWKGEPRQVSAGLSGPREAADRALGPT